MTTRAQGRHRAAVRPKTPLSTLATQLQDGAGTAGRRGAVIAASSGLVVSLGVTAADAAPIADAVEDKPTAAPAAAPAPAAEVAAEAAPPVVQLSVPADVPTATVGVVAGTLVAPPRPEPVVVPERTAPVSRSTERERAATTASGSGSGSESSAQPAAEPQAAGDLSASRANVIAVAARYVGTPYRYGGTSPAGFDCSGFVQYVFKQVGVSLPRTSSAIAGAAVRISRDQAQPGDLVYKPGHIGIYAGGNLMYDSPTTGKSVSKREIFSSEFGFYRVLDS